MPDERDLPHIEAEQNQDDGRDLAQEVLKDEQGFLGFPDHSRDARENREEPPALPKPAPREAEPGQPPLTLDTYMSEREARQKAETEAKAWRDWYAQQTNQQSQTPPIDPYMQPAEFMQERSRQIEQEIESRMQQALAPIRQGLTQVWAKNCFEDAKRQFGDKEAEEAYQEFDKGQMPRHEFEQVMRQPNPFAAAVQWKRRRDALAAMGDDPTQFREKLRAEILAELRGTPPPQSAEPNSFEAPHPDSSPQPRNAAGQFTRSAPVLPSVNRLPVAGEAPRALRYDQSDEELAQEILDAPRSPRQR